MNNIKHEKLRLKLSKISSNRQRFSLLAYILATSLAPKDSPEKNKTEIL